jgi:hypothetical protein
MDASEFSAQQRRRGHYNGIWLPLDDAMAQWRRAACNPHI